MDRSEHTLKASTGRGVALLEQLHREMQGAFDVRPRLACPRPRHKRAAQATRVSPPDAAGSRGSTAASTSPCRSTRRRPGEWIEDAWVVAERTFSPCYVGGWSACQYWGLTEQVFRTMLVVTAKKVRRSRRPRFRGTPTVSRSRPEDKLFGPRRVARPGGGQRSPNQPVRSSTCSMTPPSVAGSAASPHDPRVPHG